MVERLLGAGYSVVVYARRADVQSRLAQRGATVAASVAELARVSDILITCLFSDEQLRETGLGSGGFIANAKSGAVFVSHTTGTLATLEQLQRASPDSPVVLDAPVSGTAEDIAAGTLTVLLGGPDDAVRSVRPVLSAYANPVVATGALGTALAIKLVNNLLFAANAQALRAAIDLGSRLDVQSNALLSALQVCSGRSYAAAQAHRVGGVEPFEALAAGFLRKDVAACREAAVSSGVDLGWLGRVVSQGPMLLDSEGDCSPMKLE